MRYELKMNSTEGVKRVYSEFSEAEGVRGDVIVTFERPGEIRDWVIRNANVPLFLSNLMHFLRQVETDGKAVFTSQFSPNSNGEMRQGVLLLSRTSGNVFDKGIYDVTSRDQVDALKAKLLTDVSEFGELATH